MNDDKVRKAYDRVQDVLNQLHPYRDELRTRIVTVLAGDANKAERARAVTLCCDVDDAAYLLERAQERLAKHLPPVAGSVPADSFVKVALLDGERTQRLADVLMAAEGARGPVSHRPVLVAARPEPGLDTGSFLAGVRGVLGRNRGKWRRR